MSSMATVWEDSSALLLGTTFQDLDLVTTKNGNSYFQVRMVPDKDETLTNDGSTLHFAFPGDKLYGFSVHLWENHEHCQ